jgi:hypothetical protein
VRGTTLFTLANLEDDAQQLTGVHVRAEAGVPVVQVQDKVLQHAEPL